MQVGQVIIIYCTFLTLDYQHFLSSQTESKLHKRIFWAAKQSQKSYKPAGAKYPSVSFKQITKTRAEKYEKKIESRSNKFGNF